uniref:Uncharacterized protein n=1 Tax=Cryptomonas curvata TaxID=233186 RepID=A0A7S0M5S6_9CRYP|mmetsp:Transcript_25322/g.52752  ORF Transcript_25322/g.52752 Transcript_25322/m.52752 type:complete len:305 (+) Transcript_25322:190-1104(+)
MLYLEYCYDECTAVKYPDDNPRPSRSKPGLLRAAHPACSAATIFTLQGVRKVLKYCDPIFDGIDDMYPSLVRQGHLEAYVTYPPAVVQDGFWGSDANRQINEPFQDGSQRVHAAIAPICKEHEQSFQMMEVRQIGRMLQWSDWSRLKTPAGLRMQVETLAQDQGFETLTDHVYVVILRFPGLTPRNMASSTRDGRTGGQTVVYWTRSLDWPDFEVEVGRWNGGDCEGLLVFGPMSECSRLPEIRHERHDSVPWPNEVQPDAANWCVIEAVDEGDKDRSSARSVLLFLEPFNITHSQQPNFTCHA